jgi:hypothetical protein
LQVRPPGLQQHQSVYDKLQQVQCLDQFPILWKELHAQYILRLGQRNTKSAQSLQDPRFFIAAVIVKIFSQKKYF